MLLKGLFNGKNFKYFKNIYFISYNSHFDFKNISNINIKNKTLLIISPNLNLKQADKKLIVNSDLKFWIFDWNFFKGKYFLRWLSHNKAFKTKKRSYFLFKHIFEGLYKHPLNNFLNKNDLIENQKLFEDEYILQYLRREKINVQKIKKNYLYFLLYLIKKKTFLITKILSYNFLLILNMKKSIKIKKKKRLLGIRHYSDGFNISKNNTDKCIDWMVNNKKINIKNTIILSEENYKNSNLYKKNSYEVVSLNVFSMKNLKMNMFFLSISLLWSIINFIILPYFIFTSIKSNELYFKLLSNYFKWNIFVNNFELVSYISYHDYSDIHILRNIILRQNNCNTIHYKHTNSENVFDLKNFNKYNNVNLAYSFYDFENHWSEYSLMSSKKNHSNSLKFIISGPINYKSKKIKKKNKKKIITFFSSSINKLGVVNSTCSHYKFLYFIKSVLDEKKYLVYFKPKYNLSAERRKNAKLNNIFKNLEKNKNFYIYKKNALDLINVSDLTISMSFSSTTIEALALDRPALYVDFSNSFPNNSFNKIRNFVFKNEMKLKKKLSYLIMSTKNLKFVKTKIFGLSEINLNSNDKMIKQILNEK